MTDDLKSRLRSVGGVRHDGATRWYINPDGPEAADRIEKLEAALNRVVSLTDCWESSLISQVNEIAREALEGEDE